jgi:hypothetical protein
MNKVRPTIAAISSLCVVLVLPKLDPADLLL